MNAISDVTSAEQTEREWFKNIASALFLAEVGLMAISLLASHSGLAVFVLFQISAAAYGLAVLWLARKAAKAIPPSLPFQRPIGTVLYLIAHSIQFGFPGEIPIWLVGLFMFIGPIAIIFLFSE